MYRISSVLISLTWISSRSLQFLSSLEPKSLRLFILTIILVQVLCVCHQSPKHYIEIWHERPFSLQIQCIVSTIITEWARCCLHLGPTSTTTRHNKGFYNPTTKYLTLHKYPTFVQSTSGPHANSITRKA